MQDQPSGASNEAASPTAAQDLRDQGVVLTHVLAVHPTHLIVPELVREVTAGASDFAEDDRMERAVRDLTDLGAAPLHRRGRHADQGGDSLQRAFGG